MITMITRAVRRQWGREFTHDDALLCVWLLLPIGFALIMFGVTVS